MAQSMLNNVIAQREIASCVPLCTKQIIRTYVQELVELSNFQLTSFDRSIDGLFPLFFLKLAAQIFPGK